MPQGRPLFGRSTGDTVAADDANAGFWLVDDLPENARSQYTEQVSRLWPPGLGSLWPHRPMPNQLIDLSTLEALDQLLASPAGRPVLIYKHSLTCGSSGVAYEEIEDLLAEPSLDVTVGMVKVQAARDVSNEIARRLGVRHHSPQVLLLKDGVVVWHASHWGVTTEAMAAALGRLGSVAGS